ncbi:MAG: outer membrane beta-barrel domain-containing protein [Deltaproteobacteria bacterium]|nr:outer membrane beta-barrel domain-containing protein [Deltaproteobacteria bacterium]
MRRLFLGLLPFIGLSIWASPGQAQQAAPNTPAKAAEGDLANEPEPDLSSEPLGEDPLADPAAKKAPAAKPAVDAQAKAKAAASDIVVIPRRSFLKAGRLELQPLTGVSVNDVLIRHWGFGGDLNYFLSEVFAVGLQGMYFVKERTDREGLVGLQYNRIATINRYHWTAALNFTYLPVYGKFSLFNKYIMHWEGYISGGVGMTKTEIIPRRSQDETFSTNAITANLGAGGRLYVLDWLTFNVGLRDYVFNDKFEPTSRVPGQDIATVKKNADDQFKNNVMLYIGVGLYLPPSFNYRSPR